MSSRGLFITNPKNNNRDYEIVFETQDGRRKKLKTLRPGETFVCGKRRISVTEIERPPRLLLTESGCVPDTVGSRKI